ncbi:hypothetical protein ACH9L7_08935 [Haloferax sp. S1W]|uniref:hypothetical protein n=1 Tax=Haloferax sp. S1W TaxID=3377110 RepID=UPI0037C76454
MSHLVVVTVSVVGHSERTSIRATTLGSADRTATIARPDAIAATGFDASVPSG